jgi:hypothetical protein
MLQSASDDGLGNGWAPSRPVWNQHAYNIVNVADDSSIPVTTDLNWETWNSFREQDLSDGDASWRPNLAAGDAQVCDWTCDDNEVTMYYAVHNAGAVDAGSFEVTLVNSGGGSVDTRTVPGAVSGEAVLLGPVTLSKAEWSDSLSVYVDGADDVVECLESDNIGDLGPWPCD